MSNIYNPNGTILTPVTGATNPFNINSYTNTTPIVVETTVSNGFQTGDNVEVEGTQVVGVDGQWVIDVVDATHFQLRGSTAPGGAGGVQGIVTDYSVNPVVQIPSDGSLASAANLLTPVEASLNALPFLYRRSGRYRNYAVAFGGVADSTFTSLWSSTTISSASYTDLTSAQNMLTSGTPIAMQTQDVADIQFDGTVQFVAGSAPVVGIGVSRSFNGGGFSLIAQSAKAFGPQTLVAGTSDFLPVSLHATYRPGGFGIIQLGLQAAVLPAGSPSTAVRFTGTWQMRIVVYRPN